MKNKFVLFFLFFIIIISTIAGIFIIRKERNISNTVSINEEFVIDRIIYYSSANAVSNTTNYQNPEWNLKVYQYTDIAIYINRLNDFDSLKHQNYITEICLENWKTDLDNVKLYYLNPNNFGKSVLNPDDLIENKLEYTVINSENKDNAQNYNIPVFFQDCSNPITLRIVTELSNQYQISNEHTLNYNGTLVNGLGLGINDLNKKISFDLTLKAKDFKHIKNINLQIPYEEGEKSILDGDITIEKRENIIF